MENSDYPPPTPTGPNHNLSSTPFTTRRATTTPNPAFATKLSQMRLNLAPLVQLTTGQIHPSFPHTLFNFWLLTDAELEELASFYHQRTPCQWTARYPCPVSWPEGLSIEAKRRKIGRFIGLRGCESPVVARLLSEREIENQARRSREEEEERRGKGWYY
ncbi:hypothetical protein B0T16DRAFT_451733 [Cercophora newfieldiana]|uniref:Beta-xylosidase n=1 Tax=Cercophora newfieldiana TaxID=92897 RepID=A0AA40D0K0_9PEZI|nr:hypothetical protein B0T16DRAFT_451733 [Cercophora newfieldiana]